MVEKMQVWGHPWWLGDLIAMKPDVNKETKLISSLNTHRCQTDYDSNNNNNNGMSSLGWGWGLGLGLLTVWNQIRAQQKTKYAERTEEDFSIRGESNQVFRWCLTALIAIAHVFWIIYYDLDCSLIIYILGFLCFRHLIYNLSRETLSVWEASDWARIVHLTPDHQLIRFEPCINEFFLHKLSPDQFDSFVRRLYEFKCWYRTTRMVLLILAITWLPFLKCSRVGPEILVSAIVIQGSAFVYTRITRSGEKKPRITNWQ